MSVVMSMSTQTPDKEHMRMLEALATVSSLAFMAVIDFLLAYFGGNWLDNYFQTGESYYARYLYCIGNYFTSDDILQSDTEEHSVTGC